MHCISCGNQLPSNAKFCGACGTQMVEKDNNEYLTVKEKFEDIKLNEEKPNIVEPVKAGYSLKINDKAFAKYLKNTNRWAFIFSIILAIAAVTGFYIYGETSYEMNNSGL